MGKKAYLVGKGRSLDNASKEWFGDGKDEIWCLNQAGTVIYNLLPKANINVVQNDPWIKYVPPDNVFWYCGTDVNTAGRKVIKYHAEIETGTEALKYSAERLTGSWAAPSCLCALELMRREDIDEVIMVAFDSHFDGSRDYANVLKVQSDKIAPFDFYDTIMRRYASNHGIKLKWMDSQGKIHDDTGTFKMCILGVAMGGKYEKQTDKMIDSFIKYNPTWQVERYYGERLINALPDACKNWSDFNKCEIGRWVAMRDLLNQYDTVLYCDGDIRWYSPYIQCFTEELILTPHTVSKRASSTMRHQILKDGRANIGIIEANRGVNYNMLYDYVIGETLHDPSRYMHGKTLWLQNLVSSTADVGFDVAWSKNAGMNVASWNIRKGDRKVIKENGKFYVVCDGEKYTLQSFHFSSKSLHFLRFFGDAVNELLEDYLNE